MIKQYRKKPVVIEAIQFYWSNLDKVKEFCTVVGASESCAEVRRVTDDIEELYITTLEGEHIASIGDFIIKGVHGEYYPCKPDIFAKTYEEVVISPSDLRTCETCEGKGWTAGHSPGIHDHDEEGNCLGACPVQLQCEPCNGTGKLPASPRPASAEDVATVRSALNALAEIRRDIQAIEQYEEWSGGSPNYGTCRTLGRIKDIANNASKALAALERIAGKLDGTA